MVGFWLGLLGSGLLFSSGLFRFWADLFVGFLESSGRVCWVLVGFVGFWLGFSSSCLVGSGWSFLSVLLNSGLLLFHLDGISSRF